MCWLELKMLADWWGLQPYLWRRFIDDIWFLWRGSEEELIQFVEYLNSYHPTIKFKCKKEVNFSFTTRKVDFLDTTVWIDEDGFLQTTLYSKPSRVVQYLLPSSSHPSHITRNIPYSLGYRLKRIESTQELFESNLTKLGEELLTRGYDQSVVNQAFSRVRQLDRRSTLEKVVKQDDERITLVVPFDKRLGNLSGVLRHRWKCLLSRDPSAKTYMPLPPRVSYSRTSSLRDILVRAKVPPQSSRVRRHAALGFKKCDQRQDCSVCAHSANTTKHTCNSTGESFPITSSLSCLTPSRRDSVNMLAQLHSPATVTQSSQWGCTLGCQGITTVTWLPFHWRGSGPSAGLSWRQGRSSGSRSTTQPSCCQWRRLKVV